MCPALRTPTVGLGLDERRETMRSISSGSDGWRLRTLLAAAAFIVLAAAACGGSDNVPALDSRPGSPEGVASDLNGTYRFEITLDEARKAGMVNPEDTYPIVDTMVLEDGHLEGGPFGSGGATYSVDGDRITFHSVEYDATTTVTFTRDDQGNLHLTPVPPIDPGDAFQAFSQVWMKIG
jgi:hypothetical protein